MNTTTTTTRTRAAVAVVTAESYMIGYADLNVPGYTPTTYTYGTYEEAREAAEQLNERWGLTPEQASSIVISTMRGEFR